MTAYAKTPQAVKAIAFQLGNPLYCNKKREKVNQFAKDRGEYRAAAPANNKKYLCLALHRPARYTKSTNRTFFLAFPRAIC